MVACYTNTVQYGDGGFGQKAAVIVEKGAVGDNVVECGTEASAVEQIWQDWREGHF